MPERRAAGSAVSGSPIRAQLQTRYGVDVTAVDQLDRDVYRVDRSDGPAWVARVFPAERVAADVEAHAELLRALERAGFPAERCAHPEPVSRWGQRAVLVTEFVESGPPMRPGRAAAMLGGLLGGLHSRAGSSLRAGGAWHHLSFTGGPREEIAAAAELLDGVAGGVPARQLARFDRLREAVEHADDCADLPHAVVHPDFVPANAIPTQKDTLVIVDWTGAGRGPRLWSLGFLLWAAGARDPRLVELVVSRYRRRTMLEPEELARLEDAIAGRPLMLDCWSYCHGRLALDQAVERLEDTRRLARAIAARARDAFAAEVRG
ncbi:MAG TPA: phosphotransferase [Solirubrobacteraceae bacterium]|nr:phosphotransferase [Solirubrobacteraceae bacterium]